MIKVLYVDEKLLEEKIIISGLKIDFICETLGISPQAFIKKRKGITPFRVAEVFVLCVLLNIAPEERAKIFSPKVNQE